MTVCGNKATGFLHVFFSVSASSSDLASPDRICALSEKISNLELQLEAESQQREEAVKKLETLDGRVSELQLQVQSEVLQKQEAVEKNQVTEVRLAEVEAQLQNEAKEKMEALEKTQSMEQRLSELEMRLQEETGQKLDALLQMQAAEEKVAELERMLGSEAQQKLETTAMLEVKGPQLERQLEEQKPSESDQVDRCSVRVIVCLSMEQKCRVCAVPVSCCCFMKLCFELNDQLGSSPCSFLSGLFTVRAYKRT